MGCEFEPLFGRYSVLTAGSSGHLSVTDKSMNTLTTGKSQEKCDMITDCHQMKNC